jgi:hypothetical protein
MTTLSFEMQADYRLGKYSCPYPPEKEAAEGLSRSPAHESTTRLSDMVA